MASNIGGGAEKSTVGVENFYLRTEESNYKEGEVLNVHTLYLTVAPVFIFRGSSE